MSACKAERRAGSIILWFIMLIHLVPAPHAARCCGITTTPPPHPVIAVAHDALPSVTDGSCITRQHHKPASRG